MGDGEKLIFTFHKIRINVGSGKALPSLESHEYKNDRHLCVAKALRP